MSAHHCACVSSSMVSTHHLAQAPLHNAMHLPIICKYMCSKVYWVTLTIVGTTTVLQYYHWYLYIHRAGLACICKVTSVWSIAPNWFIQLHPIHFCIYSCGGCVPCNARHFLLVHKVWIVVELLFGEPVWQCSRRFCALGLPCMSTFCLCTYVHIVCHCSAVY